MKAFVIDVGICNGCYCCQIAYRDGETRRRHYKQDGSGSAFLEAGPLRVLLKLIKVSVALYMSIATSGSQQNLSLEYL